MNLIAATPPTTRTTTTSASIDLIEQRNIKRRQRRFEEWSLRGANHETRRVNEAEVLHLDSGLRVVPPYHSWTYTVAKSRWVGRTLYDVVSHEFFPLNRDALRKLVDAERFKVNEKTVLDDNYLFKAHDRFEHYTHFHEPYAFVSKSDVAVMIFFVFVFWTLIKQKQNNV